jgi:hypothetical protein
MHSLRSLFLALVCAACVSDEAGVARVAEPGILEAMPEPLDFGTVTLGQNVRKLLTIRNSGKAAVLVPTAMSTQAEFTITNNGCDVTLASDATCMVEVTFAPKQRGPVLNASIDFRDRARTIKSVVLSGTGSTEAALTIVKTGTGSGVVKSQEATPLINCGTDCSEVLVQTTAPPAVVLEATAAADSSFVGFSGGGCSGTAPCVLTLDAAKTVAATFTLDKAPLHVKYIEDQPGIGALTSPNSSVRCAAGCTQDFLVPLGNAVTLVPPTNAAYRFSGECAGANGSAPCTLLMDRSRTVELRASKYNYAFITSSKYTANLGGLAGANTQCNLLAGAAGLPGSFTAWLGSDTVTAKERITKTGGFIRTDGSIWIDTFAQLFPESSIRTPLWLDENKAKVANDPAVAWTGATISGMLQPGLTCSNWTLSSLNVSARVGQAQSQGPFWTQSPDVAVCGSQAHLYCLGSDLDSQVPLPSPPAMFRRAFLSRGRTAASASTAVDAMDALCRNEAGLAGLANAGQFRAFVAPTPLKSAASRFGTTTGTWLRVDNVPLAPTAADFLAGRFDVALNLHAAGDFPPQASRPRVLTGYRSGAVKATPADLPGNSCNGWTDSSLELGDGNATFAGFRLLQATMTDPVSSCAALDRHVYCLEQ